MEHDGRDKVLLLQNPNLQPFMNLAVEGFLLENLAPYSHALYLWQNDDTVVVGRNQNTYAEVNPDFKGYVTRRLSGGGAVYHDVGNLNFTFVSERRAYSVENNNKIILSALRNLGFNAELSGRNDVTVEGRKISGQAFCLRKDACYHHGTILINSDVERMRSALSPSKLKLQSKGVASVAARVGNLKDWDPDVNVDKVKVALSEAFKDFYAGCTVDEQVVDLTDGRIVAEAERISSKDWVWGKNPKAKCSIEKRFDWGTVQADIEIHGDSVTRLEIWTDSMNTDWVSTIKHKMLSTPVSQWNRLEVEGVEERSFIQIIVGILRHPEDVVRRIS